MRIIQVLPRGMRFNAKSSSSIELCVAEWVSHSAYRADTIVVAEEGDEPLLDVSVFRLPPASHLAAWRAAWSIKKLAKRTRCDLVVTQQHVPTAAKIALLCLGKPVILQTHNFIAPPQVGQRSAVTNAVTRFNLSRFAGITFVSEATRLHFQQNWPQITIPSAVINNGFDFGKWNPQPVREPSILLVGRTQEDKGILEGAIGITQFLVNRPEWNATIILSEHERNQRYFESIRQAISPLNSRISLVTGAPFDFVKAESEKAAISIVPSKWPEPFGRTALEAHAGGAALISSGTGGLREISGDAALYVDEITGNSITLALNQLASDEPLRTSLAVRGQERVRRLFSLRRDRHSVDPISERLDRFYDLIVERR